MKRILLEIFCGIIFVGLVAPAGIFAESDFSREYAPVVQGIIGQVKSLKTEYPELGNVEGAAKIQQSENPFWFEWEYEKGITYIPNPDYIPDLQCGKANWPEECKKAGNPKTIKKFEDHGISLKIIFFEGNWPGTAAVKLRSIAQMNIVVFVEGPSEIGGRIYEIIDAEKKEFEKSHLEDKK